MFLHDGGDATSCEQYNIDDFNPIMLYRRYNYEN
jgi:hypothetical protein